MTTVPEGRHTSSAEAASAPPGTGLGYEPAGFHGESPGQAPRRWRRLGRHWKPATAVLVVAACGAGGGIYYAVSRPGGASSYATAAVTTGDIRQTTSAMGTIDPAQAEQQLASDKKSEAEAVSQASAQLAADEVILASDFRPAQARPSPPRPGPTSPSRSPSR